VKLATSRTLEIWKTRGRKEIKRKKVRYGGKLIFGKKERYIELE